MNRKQTQSRKPHRVLKALLIVLAVIILLIGGVMGFALLGKEPTYALNLAGEGATGLADGTYTGEYNAFRFSNAVAVTVRDQAITDIAVRKAQAVAKPETMAALRDAVLAAQTTAVDVIAGATVDSKAYLKAVENALTGAR
jgi:uncharacterized protein with FMN-binding domain